MGDRLRAGIPPRYVTTQLGQLSLASLWGRLIEYPVNKSVCYLLGRIAMHSIRCRPFVHMSRGLSVCLLVCTSVSTAKTAEPTEMLFRGVDCRGQETIIRFSNGKGHFWGWFG